MLTEAQKHQLEAIGDGFTGSTWGGKPHGGWPKGLTPHQIWLLKRKGYVTETPGQALQVHYKLTPAGRAILDKQEAERG